MAASASANVVEIQKQYLQMVPLNRFQWRGIDQIEPDVQRKILDMTYFSSTTNSKCTPSVSYQRSFLKYLLKLCEDNGDEVSDKLYEAYGEVLSKVEDRNEMCYKTYILPCGAMLAVEESQQLISRGTTGLNTWPAALYLAEWALENSSVFQERSIMELGCGVGLTGLVICSMCSPQQYIFTDCHEDVHDALQHNLELNGFTPSRTYDTVISYKRNYLEGASSLTGKASTLSGGAEDSELPQKSNMMSNQTVMKEKDGAIYTGGNCGQRSEIVVSELQDIIETCMSKDAMNRSGKDVSRSEINMNTSHLVTQFLRKPLTSYKHVTEDCGNHSESVVAGVGKLQDWQTVKKSDLEGFCAGIILAADVVYDVDLISPLVKTLHTLLGACGDVKGKPVAYIASTVRNPQTYQCFLDKLGEYKISWTELSGPTSQTFYYDKSCDIKLIELQMEHLGSK